MNAKRHYKNIVQILRKLFNPELYARENTNHEN